MEAGLISLAFQKGGDFRLPDLLSFELGPLADVETIESSFTSSDDEAISEVSPIEEDFWAFPSEDQSPQTRLRTWQDLSVNPARLL